MLPASVGAAPEAARPGAGAPGTPAKKLIYYGWNARDTRYLREHWREMEQMPFDGLGINVAIDPEKPTVGDGATANILGWHVFGPTAFRMEQFRSAIEDLRSVRSQKLTDNFLAACIASNDQDKGLTWFDEARWKTIVNNWRILSVVAREGGCKGILLDVEHYDYKCELFCYRHHREQRVDRPFSEYQAIARRRGRDLMLATRKVFPDIVIPNLYLYGICLLESGKPLEERRYALLPAFLDGMLEASDERARFIDLWEFAYGYKTRAQFLEGYHSVVNRAAAACSVPDLYHARVRAGFGLFLDNGGRWDAKDFAKNYFSPAEFGQSLRTALELSDGYVWIFSQKPAFFPPADLPDAYLQAMVKAR